ncbi:peptidase S41 [Hoylesella timonensis]|uniref:Tricorn protease homolog n=1 Tax=Hoylesella timonensis TaxID=386414 RepID=A0A2K0XF50_9BACT|nr:S41 family peptidase [Hoylesella timonensis]PNP93159.1 peptidase S41 [Hoylesella timonensis]
MKKTLIFAALTLSLSVAAQTNPLWMRHTSISPDGQTIAFSYKGDVFTVPASGGQARQLTSNAAYDSYPIWSPDGSKIAFASSREGSLDIFVMDKFGGEPKRLTTRSTNETPIAWRDNEHILFSAAIMPTAKSIFFASSQFPQVYEVNLKGDRPKLFSVVNMEDLSINQKGEILYHDKKGYEDPFRKHHRSPITRDIWLNQNGKFTKLTTFNGEDRTPRWAPDGESFYYLSEEDGTFNVYKRGVKSANKTQITHHTKHPVRYLSVAQNGRICYSYDGEIYTQMGSAAPQKVNVSITADRNDIDLRRQINSWGATEIALSPNGKEIGFVLHGDVYVTNIEYKTTKQITDTPEQERSIGFSPDGLAIVYASEREGLWQIYQTTMKNKAEKQFAYATDLQEERLIHSAYTSFQPQYSPDGKSIAFFENRGTLKVLDVKSKKVRTVMDGKYVYSYSDGDIWFEWSPDSKWLISNYIGTGGWNNRDIALIDAEGKKPIYNLTQSGYNDGNGKWVLGGKAIIFQSDRAGYRSHGSWGAEDDVYIMFFDLDEYEKFKMTKEEKSLLDEAEKEKKKAEEPKTVDVTVKKKEKKEEPIKLDLDNCRDRVLRLTVNSCRLGDAVLSNDGNALYYQAAFEGGYDLWKHDLQDKSTKIVLKGVGGGGMLADKDFKNLYLCSGGGIKKIDIGSNSSKNVDFEARFNYKPYQEREYMFNHIWQQVKDKFYKVDLHGVDWDGYKKSYARFLPYINNNYDFSEMLSEILGELNASHTGARYFGGGANLSTATLGLFYDQTYDGDGLKVEEVINRGPFSVKKTGVTKGCIIEKIDGEPILKDKDYYYMLDGKSGRNVRVSVYNPATKKRFDVTVKAISKGYQDELLYRRWVDRNRQLVDSLSHGRLAYVHVKAMDSESFRTVFHELLSDKNRNREAVIVDERHNGGGWLHDDLCTLLSGKQYQSFVPRGQFIGKDPWNKWTKPSCVMVCEDDYSNGHGFPFVYKELGIGKLIGTPVAGTMTAVWWETLIDNTMVFGIPQVGCRDMRGNFGENTQLNPDIEVYNTPKDYINGNDQQLKRAVEEMLKK